MQLELKNIHKTFGQQLVFNQLNFDFSSPGLYLLSGKSGSGKTTLLNIIAGYEAFDLGNREIAGCSIACIFQSYELIQELTVLENIKMGVDLHQQTFDESLLVKLGLEELKNHYPDELSGGQKQRVGIARALYLNPDIIICDEPTESLDIDNKELILGLLKGLSKEKVVLVASHELENIANYYDFHYEIINHQLICKDQKKERSEIKVHKKENRYDSKSLKYYIHQLVHRKTWKAILWFSLLLIVQILLYGIDTKLFAPKTTLDALNSHVVYVELYNETPNIIKGEQITVKPILSFKPMMIDSKRYKVNIYPNENENYQLLGNEIIINKQALDLFKNEDETSIIGKKIELTYEVINRTFDVSLIVKEVVEEQDAYYPQLFYNQAYFTELLKRDDVYSLFQDYSTTYEVITNNSKVENLYLGLSTVPNIRISHSILDMRNQNKNQIAIYHLLFVTVEIISLITNLISIIYFNNKDYHRNKTGLSLIHSLQIPIKITKWEYFKQKVGYMLVANIIISLLLFPITKLLDGTSLYLVLGYIEIVTIVYILSLAYQTVRFKAKDISMILKDNKDT